jgi:hypothetical protein
VQSEKQSADVGFLNDVEDWRTRAKAIRVIAETMLDGASRQGLLQIANDWEWMAQSAEEEKIAALISDVEAIPSISTKIYFHGVAEFPDHSWSPELSRCRLLTLSDRCSWERVRRRGNMRLSPQTDWR